MVRLSVNLNKIALLRNSRTTGVPDVLRFGRLVIAARCEGITVHPRPDARHIRTEDVFGLAALMKDVRPGLEYNIEGRPTPEFLDLVRKVVPEQVTLVPDAPGVLTSDQGWTLDAPEQDLLRPIVAELKAVGARVILFMNPDAEAVTRVPATGADGIEVYTGTFAAAFRAGPHAAERDACIAAATAAQERKLIVNAGHDLNLRNLPEAMKMPGLREVSIGHELTADALLMGFSTALAAYRAVLRGEA
jgi:pyridoxine 5-phosphate synthase